MIVKSTAQPALLALLVFLAAVPGVSAQDRGRVPGPGSPDDERARTERFFGYLDRNQDGRLDREEMQRLPGSFRETLERSEINVSNGLSKEQFLREIPRAMEESRRRREEEYRNRSGGDSPSSYRRSDDSRRSDDRRREEERKNSSYVYSPSKRDPVTMKIPRRFEDGDTDKDGQIGLYEWRQWRPEEKYHFRVYDINGDGFLTPKELAIPPTQEEINNYLTSIGVKVDTSSSDRSRRFGDRSRFGGSRDGSSSPGDGAPGENNAPQEPKQDDAPEQNDSLARTAGVLFKSLDADKNGKITSEEWVRSVKLKPKFEAAGYDLSQAMDEQQFIAAYRKAYGKP